MKGEDAEFRFNPILPRLFIVLVFVVLGWMLMLPVQIAFGFPQFSWAAALVTVVVVGMAGFVWTFPRMALILRPDGVECRNWIRTYRFSWSEVEEIGVKYVWWPGGVSKRRHWTSYTTTPPGVGFRLTGGRQLPAVQVTSWLLVSERDELLAVLRHAAEKHEVKFTLSKDNLPAMVEESPFVWRRRWRQ